MTMGPTALKRGMTEAAEEHAKKSAQLLMGSPRWLPNEGSNGLCVKRACIARGEARSGAPGGTAPGPAKPPGQYQQGKPHFPVVGEDSNRLLLSSPPVPPNAGRGSRVDSLSHCFTSWLGSGRVECPEALGAR